RIKDRESTRDFDPRSSILGPLPLVDVRPHVPALLSVRLHHRGRRTELADYRLPVGHGADLRLAGPATPVGVRAAAPAPALGADRDLLAGARADGPGPRHRAGLPRAGAPGRRSGRESPVSAAAAGPDLPAAGLPDAGGRGAGRGGAAAGAGHR